MSSLSNATLPLSSAAETPAPAACQLHQVSPCCCPLQHGLSKTAEMPSLANCGPAGSELCLQQPTPSSLSIASGSDCHTFSFDSIASPDVEQEGIFQRER